MKICKKNYTAVNSMTSVTYVIDMYVDIESYKRNV